MTGLPFFDDVGISEQYLTSRSAELLEQLQDEYGVPNADDGVNVLLEVAVFTFSSMCDSDRRAAFLRFAESHAEYTKQNILKLFEPKNETDVLAGQA